MSDAPLGLQQIQAREEYIKQHINEAYEMIRKDIADPPIQPEIQLKEGWRNGNIKIGIGAPTKDTGEHTWDVYLDVASVTSDDWEAVTAVYVRTPA